MIKRKLRKAVFVILSVTGIAVAAPKIEFSLTKYNFGKVEQGEKASYDFKFSNTGTDALIIEEVRSSCGCTATKPSKKNLSPGESGKIGVTFNTKGYAGNVRKTVTVRSNDPEQSSITLAIEGIVSVDIRVLPSNIYVYSNEIKDPKSPAKRQIEVRNFSEKSYHILSVKSETPSVYVDIDPLAFPIEIHPEETQYINLDIAVLDMEKKWKKLGDVIVETDSKKNSKFTVGIFVSKQ